MEVLYTRSLMMLHNGTQVGIKVIFPHSASYKMLLFLLLCVFFLIEVEFNIESKATAYIYS